MMACDIWLRRDYLIRHGRTPDEPPCGHDPQHCPPPGVRVNLPTHITRAQITAAFQPSEGEYAEITQVGRWLYAICIRDGLMVTNPPWYRLGRRSAQRKARRELARRVQQEAREQDAQRIYLKEQP